MKVTTDPEVIVKEMQLHYVVMYDVDKKTWTILDSTELLPDGNVWKKYGGYWEVANDEDGSETLDQTAQSDLVARLID